MKNNGLKRFLSVFFVGIPVFVFAVPYLLWFFGKKISGLIGAPAVFVSLGWKIFAVLLLILGGVFAFWSVWYMLYRGKATPLSVSPKGELLTGGPYAFTRNPMWFGTIMMYTGFAILTQSAGTVILVALLWVVFPLYLKFVEEKKLIERFGQEYELYRKQVPMLFPRFYCPFKKG